MKAKQKNLNEKNPGGGLLIVYTNQKEEHRFVRPFVVIGRVAKPLFVTLKLTVRKLIVSSRSSLYYDVPL